MKWLPDMAVGIDEMDQAHKWFLTELERLQTVPDFTLGAEIMVLTSAMACDFQEEESLMEEIGSPDLHAHREQHKRVLEAFQDIAPGDFPSMREVLAMMPRWFLFHLTAMDFPLAIAARSALGLCSTTQGQTSLHHMCAQPDSKAHFYRSSGSPATAGGTNPQSNLS